jgi:hypothetical protein
MGGLLDAAGRWSHDFVNAVCVIYCRDISFVRVTAW